ncbi:MAG: hypothetical protein OSJ64_05930, partial [Firmicutes bacterium]|nr:hypothetical protein [Bacillota bacterium]
QQHLQQLNEEREALAAGRETLAAADRELELQYLGKVKDVTHLRDNLADKNEQLVQLQNALANNQREQEHMQRRQTELTAELADWGSITERANQLLVELQQRQEQQSSALEAGRQALEQNRLQALAKRQEHQNLTGELTRLTAEKGSLFEQKEQKEQNNTNQHSRCSTNHRRERMP